MELFKLFGTIAVRNDEANDAIDETTNLAEQSESKMSSAFKKIGSAVAAAFAVDKIIDFGKEIVNVSATVAAEQSAFEQIMGDYSDNAQKKVNEVADATGVVATRLTPYMTSLTAKFKGLGYDIDDSTDLATIGLTLASDAAAFWDKSMEDSMGALNSFINGSYEGGEAIGIFANDTQMASYAVKQGIVSEAKDWSSLDEARKQATRLEYAENMMKASGATGQAAKEADQYANVQANLTEKWRQFKAQIGEPLLQNIVLPAMSKLSELVDTASEKFESLKTWVSENKTLLLALGAVIGSLTAGIIAYNIAQAAMTLGSKLHAAATLAEKLSVLGLNTAMLASPITWVVAAIVALIAIFVLLWNKCEGFRNFWINLWDKIKTAFAPVIEFVKSAFESLKEKVQTGILPALKEFWAAVQEKILPILSLIWDYIQIYIKPAFEYFKIGLNQVKIVVQAAFEIIKTIISTVFANIKVVITTAWNHIKIVIDTALNVIKNIIKLATSIIKGDWSGAWNAIKNIFSSIWNGIKSIVSNIWNGIKSIFSNNLNAIKSSVSTVFNAVKATISNVINGAKNIVSSGLNAIKNFFSNLKLKFPSIKLPHFSIKGSFSLSPPSVPKLSIDWYAKAMDNAMLLNSPTIFGMNPNGSLLGGGEAGQEVVSGSTTLMNMIRGAVQEENSGIVYYLERLNSMLAAYFPELLSNLEKEIVLDDGTLVGKLAPKMDSKLGDINKLRARGV